jgi:serine kinase of HPr protein (carbohydrate metabolism regulator)
MVAWLQFASVVQSGVPLETTRSILDVRVPQVTIPVQPGRNPAVLIEVAALNLRAARIPNYVRDQNGAA